MERTSYEVAKISTGAQLRQAQCAVAPGDIAVASELRVVTIQTVADGMANIQECCWSASWNCTMEDTSGCLTCWHRERCWSASWSYTMELASGCLTCWRRTTCRSGPNIGRCR